MKDFLLGVRFLLRGLGMYVRSPGLLGLGIIPALISGLLFIAGFGTLVYFSPALGESLTWFADGWTGWLRSAVRVVATLGIVGLGGLLGVLTFTAVTLLIGDPFYEKISGRVEERYGGVPDEVEVSWHRSLTRSIGDSLRVLLVSVCVGVPLFFFGFIPVVGQTVIPVLAAAVGGWFLSLELVAVPYQRRGLRLVHRRAALRGNRPMAIGFGMAVFACFLIPLGAVLVMPAAVAGGTLLARHLMGLRTSEG